jgi:hypothetical protein
VLANTNGVLEVILSTLEAPLPARYARHPLPASRGEGKEGSSGVTSRRPFE